MKILPLVIAIAAFATCRGAVADSCIELAEAFANDVDKMSDIELGRLQTCVKKALRDRLFKTDSPPPRPKPHPMPRAISKPKTELQQEHKDKQPNKPVPMAF